METIYNIIFIIVGLSLGFNIITIKIKMAIKNNGSKMKKFIIDKYNLKPLFKK